MTKTVTIQIPCDKELKETNFSPEENYLMLKVGTEYLLEARKAVVELTQVEIYNKLKEESKEEIRKLEQKLEIDCLVQKEVYKQLEVKIRSIYDDFIANMKEDNEMTVQKYKNEVQKYENEVNTLKKSLKEYTEKMRQIDEDPESILNVKLNIEREKWKIRDKEIDMTIAEYEKKIDKLVTTNDALLASMNKTTHMKGSEGERLLYDLMKNTFQDFAGFDIIDMHTKGGEGDFHLHFDEFNILADAKNYKLHVPSAQREKIKKDLIKNDHIEFGWLVSLNSNIDKYDKSPVMYEWVNTKQCLVYINNLCNFDDPSKLLRIIWFTCKELTKLMNRQIENENNIEVEEEIAELKDYRFKMIDKVNKLRKSLRQAQASLNTLRNMIVYMDEELKEMLGEHTNEFVNSHSSVFDDWWNANIEYVDHEDSVLKVTELWFKFRRDNKDIVTKFNITLDNFKNFIKTTMQLSALVFKKRSVNSSFDIKGIKLKMIDVVTEINEKQDVVTDEDTDDQFVNEKVVIEDVPKEKKRGRKKKVLTDNEDNLKFALADNEQENVVISTEIPEVKSKPKKKKVEKNAEFYFNDVTDQSIIAAYENIQNDIFVIAKSHNVEIFQVVSVLCKHKVISKRIEARGYTEYVKTEEYQSKCTKEAGAV